MLRVTRITVDVNDAWLEAAKDILGTKTKVGTINEALRSFAIRRRAAEIVAALDSVSMTFTSGDDAWGYGGGRDLSRLVEQAREAHAS